MTHDVLATIPPITMAYIGTIAAVLIQYVRRSYSVIACMYNNDTLDGIARYTGI